MGNGSGGRKEGSRWCLLTEYNFYLVTSRDLSCISFSKIKKNWSLMYTIIEACRSEILVGLECARMWMLKIILAVGVELENVNK